MTNRQQRRSGDGNAARAGTGRCSPFQSPPSHPGTWVKPGFGAPSRRCHQTRSPRWHASPAFRLRAGKQPPCGPRPLKRCSKTTQGTPAAGHRARDVRGSRKSPDCAPFPGPQRHWVACVIPRTAAPTRSRSIFCLFSPFLSSKQDSWKEKE